LEFNVPFQHKYGYIRDERAFGVVVTVYQFCHFSSVPVCLSLLGKDPLLDKLDGKDINSVAGVLKLYFRELKDPLFPFHMFDDLMACSSNCNFNSQFSSHSLTYEYVFSALMLLVGHQEEHTACKK